jgi:hypothetical protein
MHQSNNQPQSAVNVAAASAGRNAKYYIWRWRERKSALAKMRRQRRRRRRIAGGGWRISCAMAENVNNGVISNVSISHQYGGGWQRRWEKTA